MARALIVVRAGDRLSRRIPVDHDLILGHVVAAVAGLWVVGIAETGFPVSCVGIQRGWRRHAGWSLPQSRYRPRHTDRNSKCHKQDHRQDGSQNVRGPMWSMHRWLLGRDRGTPATRAGVATSGQRSTCAMDLRLRSRCHATKAAVKPLASRATRSSTWRVSLQRPSSSAPSNARVSGAGRAAPDGRHRSHTAPPKAGEKARWGPAMPQRAQAEKEGA